MVAYEFLNEMSLSVGDIDIPLTDIANKNKEIWSSGNHVGDIENYRVLLYNNIYTMWSDNDLVSYVSVTKSAIESMVEINYWVNKKYRNQKILSKILWFLKTRENYSSMIIGNVHSRDTRTMLSKGGLSKFNKSWFNIKTKEKIPYDPSSDTKSDDGKFRSLLKTTDWVILLENDGDFKDWPRFKLREGHFDIRSLYSIYE